MRSVAMVICLYAIAAVPACDSSNSADRAEENSDPVMAFDTGSVQIETAADTFHLTVEIAERDDQKVHGLMERLRLPETSGMLFLYSELQDSSSGFWMFRTRIPLDIAYLGDNGQILSIAAMEPCSSPYTQSCMMYAAGVRYCAALEVNRGFFTRRRIGLGDRVVLNRKAAEPASSPAPLCEAGSSEQSAQPNT
jgi:uncharacterized membrane protein (UPF0127 family)